MWADAIPGRDEQQALKRKAIVRAAARLMSRRGSHGATLDDVADRLGVSKAALYRYVSNKNDLILACHEEALAIAERCLDHGEEKGATGLEKIRLGLRCYLVEMIRELGVPALILEENVLQGEAAERNYANRDTYERRMRRLVAEGQQDGSIVPAEPKIAVFMLLGSIHWLAKWYCPDGDWQPEQVADAIVELATRALEPSPAERLSAELHGGAGTGP
jgi:TetR/AcrR family transcriptional regulator